MLYQATAWGTNTADVLQLLLNGAGSWLLCVSISLKSCFTLFLNKLNFFNKNTKGPNSSCLWRFKITLATKNSIYSINFFPCFF